MKTCADCIHHIADATPENKGMGHCAYEPPKVLEAGKSAFPVVKSDTTRCGKLTTEGFWR
jgi:hypothetical protein